MLKIFSQSWNDVLTLTWLSIAQLELLLLVGQLAGVPLAEEGVQVALVPRVGQAHQDREEEEGEDCLPDIDPAGRGGYQDEHQPDVGKDRGGRSDAEHNKISNSETQLQWVNNKETRDWTIYLVFSLRYSL